MKIDKRKGNRLFTLSAGHLVIVIACQTFVTLLCSSDAHYGQSLQAIAKQSAGRINAVSASAGDLIVP